MKGFSLYNELEYANYSENYFNKKLKTASFSFSPSSKIYKKNFTFLDLYTPQESQTIYSF